MDIIIRRATFSDVDVIFTIQALCYLNIPLDRPEVIQEKIELFSAGCLVAEQNSQVVGYVLSHPWNFVSPPKLDDFLLELPNCADCYFLHDLAVAPHARCQGIAAALLQHVEQNARGGCFNKIALISVGNSFVFWSNFGFKDTSHEQSMELIETLMTYQSSAKYLWKAIEFQNSD